MTSWLKRTQAGIQSAPTTPAVPSAPVSAFVPAHAGRVLDPNAPDARLDIESRCIYERRLPGEAYITAHVTRLQDGFYDSPSTHGDCIENVRFLAVSLVFHPSETGHRFQAAMVTIGLHDDTDQAFTDPAPGHKVLKEPRNKPKFLRYAPHVLFGGVSPETLDWNFNLTGSLGVSQTPASASISPSGGIKGSYKIYQMMRIQGSTRTLLARHHHEYDIEDGEICWTMEENTLQKSGLPREMTFVMMITKGDVENVVCDIDIKPRIASWFGHYPAWWSNALKYRPIPKEHVDLDMEMGQKFEPTVPGRGFNFANLAGTFNDFVSLPGTTYSLTDKAFANQTAASGAKTGQDDSNKNANLPQGQDSQQNQSAQASRSIQPPPRPQTVPPPSEMTSSEAPMDYHIYLHNPRTINLHATPPPQPSSSPPVAAPTPSQTQSHQYNYQPAVNIIRPKSTAPNFSSSQERKSSPANTKMKRRSIDITNIKNSPYYDEAKTPLRNPSVQSSSGGSLRRRRSKTDLRYSPVVEEKSRSVSGESSSSTSRSSRLSLVRSLSNPSSPKPIIEAPSPPDPGLSGFKARLQAHMASEREREREYGRHRTQPRARNTDRLPFEVQPESYRPPRDITPSPDPTDNPNSDTTQESLIEDQRINTSGSSTDATATDTKANANPNPHLLDVTTNIPTRRERLNLTSPPPSQSHTQLSRQQTSPDRRRSPAPRPPSPDPVATPTAKRNAITNGTHPHTRSPKATSPPTASLSGLSIPRILSPYKANKWDGFRASPNGNASSPAARPRRESSASLSPDQSEIGLAVDEIPDANVDAQPIAGDLREEAKRRARQRSLKRLSMPMAPSVSFGSGGEKTDIGMGDGVNMGKENMGGMAERGYEYITAAEADGDWEDR